MTPMTHEDRIRAALAHEEVDRIPFGMWYHVPHIDQDPIHLAEESLRQAEVYDLDFVKMCPFGNYGAVDFGLSCTYYATPTQPVLERRFAVDDPADWARLPARSGDYASHGKQLQAAEHLGRLMARSARPRPFLQTIFSPLTTAKKVTGPRIADHLRSHPDAVHAGLEAITATTVDFVAKNLQAGVSGFFFASQCSTTDLLTQQEYEEFGRRYDERVLQACREAWFNVVHIHGDHTMWDLMAGYDVPVVNWHDRWTAPSLAQARARSGRTFMGGIDESSLLRLAVDDVLPHLRAAVEDHGGGRGLILAPGCVADPSTPVETIMAARLATEQLGPQ